MSADHTTAPRTGFFRHRAWLPLMLGAAMLVAALSHGTLFGNYAGYRAVYAGIGVGAASSILAWRLKWGPRRSIVATVVVALLVSGVAALPHTTIYGVIPTLEGMREALRATVTSWKDLLTVSAPVPATSHTLLMPYTAGVMTASVTMSLALRRRHYILALIPIFFLLSVGVLWGTHHAPLAPIVGAVGGIIALLTVVRSQRARDEQAGERALTLTGERRHGRTRAVGSALVLLLAGALGAAGTFTVARHWDESERVVLRDYFEPQLDVRQYASPVSQFRAWNTHEAELELFTLGGVSPGTRLRLATLDTYDGTVFRLSNGDSSASVGGSAAGDATFKKVFVQFNSEKRPQSQVRQMDVTVALYSGHWVLGVDEPRSVTFAGPRARDLQDSLYFSQRLSTLLSTRPLTEQDHYTVDYVAPPTWTDAQLEQARIASMPSPSDVNVPREIAQVAAQMTDGANIGLQQIRAIQHKMSSSGFYSDGSDGMSRSGHRADRLAHFLSAQYMVGDDDQYAPAMVLMLRSLGIPARLAMGFIPEGEGDQVAVRGRDVHMWVEVPFEELGWVVFEPTPPKDQTLRTEVPKPKPQIRPQVVQPPDPPADPAEVQADEVPEFDDKKDEEEPRLPWLLIAGSAAGAVGVLVLPIVVIAALKALRALRRRRQGDGEMRSVGAWDELVDRVRDLGVRVPRGEARSVQARLIDDEIFAREGTARPTHPDSAGGAESRVSSRHVVAVDGMSVAFRPLTDARTQIEVLADEVDAAVFSPHPLSADDARLVWQRMYEVVASARGRVGWKRRLRGLVSPVTLLSRWTRPIPRKHRRSANLDVSLETRENAGKDGLDG